MKCEVCNGTGWVSIGHGIRGIKKCKVCQGTGIIADAKSFSRDACPICGTLFPTDEKTDYIPVEEINFCYHCGAKVKE